MAAIHQSQLFEYVQAHKEFAITWIKESGQKVFIPRACVTSFFSSGLTMNIKSLNSNEILKVNRLTVIEIDGMEVFQ